MIDMNQGASQDWGWGRATPGASSRVTAGQGNLGASLQNLMGAQAAQTGPGLTAGAGGGTTGGSMETINYPGQWGAAGDAFSRLMNSDYQAPSALGQAQDWMSRLWGQGGGRVDTSGIWNNIQPTLNRAFKEGLDTLQERWGATNPGVSMSSGLQRSGADLWSRLLENAGLDMANKQIMADENAYNRMAALPGMMTSLGGTQGGLGQNWMRNQLDAAHGMASLGDRYAQLPMQVAAAMQGAGGYQSSQAIDPWMQFMSGILPQGTTQATYQPTRMDNIMGILGNPNLWSGIFGGGRGDMKNLVDTGAALARTQGYGGIK